METGKIDRNFLLYKFDVNKLKVLITMINIFSDLSRKTLNLRKTLDRNLLKHM